MHKKIVSTFCTCSPNNDMHWVWIHDQLYRQEIPWRLFLLRHGPFDILGGGGLGLMSGPENFFRTISEQGYFFRRPFGPDYFFHNRKL